MKVNEREKSHNQYESDQMKSSEYGGVGEGGIGAHGDGDGVRQTNGKITV